VSPPAGLDELGLLGGAAEEQRPHAVASLDGREGQGRRQLRGHVAPGAAGGGDVERRTRVHGKDHPELALLNEPLTGSLTTPIQFGMIAALKDDDTADRRQSLRTRSIKAAQILNENGFSVEPVKGGMFYFLDISVTGMDGDAFADALLAEEHVAVVPGSGFGLEVSSAPGEPLEFAPNDLASRCIRLCFGVPEELLLEGVKRIAAFIARHSK